MISDDRRRLFTVLIYFLLSMVILVKRVMVSTSAVKLNEAVCVLTTVVLVVLCLQGLNPGGKDSQVGRDGVRRKDWHDYEAIKRDLSRSGRSRTVCADAHSRTSSHPVCFRCAAVTHRAYRPHIVPSRKQLPYKRHVIPNGISHQRLSHSAQLLSLVRRCLISG